MWFPIAWLSLGFALKWIREAFENFDKKWGDKMFNIVLIILSFALVVTLAGVFKMGGGILSVCLLFWFLVCLMIKAN